MHYFAAVLIPAEVEVDEAVEAAMAPFDENLETAGDEGNPEGRWDWYQVGGRWTGVWSEYEPYTDPANWTECFICKGTGMRMDTIGVAHRAQHPDYTCNGCAMANEGLPIPLGMAVKHASEWVRHDHDVVPVKVLANNLGRLRSPHGLLTPDGWVETERWDGNDFVKHPDFDTAYREALEKYPDMLAAVVDYHG